MTLISFVLNFHRLLFLASTSIWAVLFLQRSAYGEVPRTTHAEPDPARGAYAGYSTEDQKAPLASQEPMLHYPSSYNGGQYHQYNEYR